jgi:hypothetical protein
MSEHGQPLSSRSVQEEGLYLLVRPCEKCQAGPLEEISREESQIPGGIQERVKARCNSCGEECVLAFTRPNGETSTSQSQLIDVAEWLGLCHHFMDLAQTNPQEERSHEQIVSARYCLNEALKFYPEDSHLPPPSAFFGRLGDQRYKEHPAVFLKTKLLDLRRRLGVLAGQSSKAQQTGTSKKRKWWRTE